MEISDIKLPPTRFWNNILGGLFDESRIAEQKFLSDLEFFKLYLEPGLPSLATYCARANLGFQAYIDMGRVLGYPLPNHPDIVQRFPLAD